MNWPLENIMTLLPFILHMFSFSKMSHSNKLQRMQCYRISSAHVRLSSVHQGYFTVHQSLQTLLLFLCTASQLSLFSQSTMYTSHFFARLQPRKITGPWQRFSCGGQSSARGSLMPCYESWENALNLVDHWQHMSQHVCSVTLYSDTWTITCNSNLILIF